MFIQQALQLSSERYWLLSETRLHSRCTRRFQTLRGITTFLYVTLTALHIQWSMYTHPTNTNCALYIKSSKRCKKAFSSWYAEISISLQTLKWTSRTTHTGTTIRFNQHYTLRNFMTLGNAFMAWKKTILCSRQVIESTRDWTFCSRINGWYVKSQHQRSTPSHGRITLRWCFQLTTRQMLIRALFGGPTRGFSRWILPKSLCKRT